MSTNHSEVIQAAATAIRVLTVDAVKAAGIGHVGLPLGCAEIGAVLFGEVMRHDPSDPEWPDRDRFVLSAGHGSMMLYALLHLAGYPLTLEDISQFRKLGSKTPGHPEHGLTRGVETTTGPLGQGLGNAVGMALAERLLAARFGSELVDHRTYVLASDGDMMEGVASEAASLAGHLRLGKLICVYDDNGITIDGKTEIAFREDVGRRFEAYGWAVQRIDGHDVAQIRAALVKAQSDSSQPQLIIAKTHIGKGSPAVDTSSAHGHLSDANVEATRKALGWDLPPFQLPAGAYGAFDGAKTRGKAAREAWAARKERALADEAKRELWQRMIERKLPELDRVLPNLATEKNLATRQASGKVLNAVASEIPSLIGGSADLAGSNGTNLSGHKLVGAEDFSGRNLAFGVREHGMGAIANGLALHGGVRPYVATFLVFSDYMRPSIRLAALMEQPVTYVFTHDSIFVGEDGPTHQPVEHAAALRAIPNLEVWRPADPRETVAAWRAALTRTDGPVALLLTRQAVPTLEGTTIEVDAQKGGYRLLSCAGAPELVIVATGSEVGISLEAAKVLTSEGRRVWVVSLPCVEAFERQAESYRDAVLGKAPRLVVEAGVAQGLASILRPGDRFHGMKGFGASASYTKLAEHFGFTARDVARLAREMLG